MVTLPSSADSYTGGGRRGGPAPPPGIDEWRPGQAEIVEESWENFDAGIRLVMLDVPTGVGKGPISAGIAYMLGGRNIYTATTKALQDAVVVKIDGAERVFGRANYPSVYRPDLTCDQCHGRSLCPDPKRTDGPEECSYRRQKLITAASSLAVLNTAYYIGEANGVGMFSGWDLAVLDEGEAIEERVRAAATVKVSRRQVDEFGLEPPRGGAETDEIFAWAQRELRPRVAAAIENAEVSYAMTPGWGAARDLARFEELRRALWAQATAGVDHLVGWVDGWGGVVLEPVIAAPFGVPLLWRHADRFLLASGSLIDPAAVAAELGWTEPFAVVSRPSPFPVENRQIFVRPVGSMSARSERSTQPAMLAAIREIFALHPGQRGLIHAVSYDRAAAIAEALLALGERRVILAEKRNGPDDADVVDPDLERFKATPGAVLVSPRHERGVDLPDDLCRFIVCPKAPFEVWGDLRVQARMAMPDGGRWYRQLAPARRVVQMTGRGVRHPDDFCTSYLLDGDFVRSSDGGRPGLLYSDLLPAWWKASLRMRRSWM